MTRLTRLSLVDAFVSIDEKVAIDEVKKVPAKYTKYTKERDLTQSSQREQRKTKEAKGILGKVCK